MLYVYVAGAPTEPPAVESGRRARAERPVPARRRLALATSEGE